MTKHHDDHLYSFFVPLLDPQCRAAGRLQARETRLPGTARRGPGAGADARGGPAKRSDRPVLSISMVPGECQATNSK